MISATTSHPSAGFGLAAASAGFFACMDVAVRYCAPYLNLWQIIFGRSLLGLAAMVLLARLLRLDLFGRQRKTLLLAGLAGGIGVICLTAALLLLPLFQALVLLYLYPLFAAAIAPLITGDRFRRGDWFALTCGLAGTVLVLWPAGGPAGRFSLGHLLGLTAAGCYALAMNLIRRTVNHSGPLAPLFYITAVAGLACAFPAVLTPLPQGTLFAEGLLALGALTLFGLLAYLTSNLALGRLPAPTVGVIAMLEVVFSALLGLFLFHETLSVTALLGGAVILASGLFLTLKPTRPPLQVPTQG